MWSLDKINLSALQSSIKTVSIDRTWEQTNLQTPVLSRVIIVEKVRIREENNMATLRLVQRRQREEEVLQGSELRFFYKLW